MALTRENQYVELLRQFTKEPPRDIPRELQATLDASLKAYKEVPAETLAKWLGSIKDERVASINNLNMDARLKAQMVAAVTAASADTAVG